MNAEQIPEVTGGGGQDGGVQPRKMVDAVLTLELYETFDHPEREALSSGKGAVRAGTRIYVLLIVTGSCSAVLVVMLIH